MDRRAFIKSAAIGTVALGVTGEALAAGRFYPARVDMGLFENINRAADPNKKTPIEMKHVPYIKAPAAVKAGEPFVVEVSVGEEIHPMGQTHWIEFVTLEIGNEPAARAEFEGNGYAMPKAVFTVVISKEAAPAGKATLVAHQRCNLHGYWEGVLDVQVA